MALSPNNTLQQNLFETIKSNMETKEFKIDDPKMTVNTVSPTKKSRIKLSRVTVLSQQVGNRVQRA